VTPFLLPAEENNGGVGAAPEDFLDGVRGPASAADPRARSFCKSFFQGSAFRNLAVPSPSRHYDIIGRWNAAWTPPVRRGALLRGQAPRCARNKTWATGPMGQEIVLPRPRVRRGPWGVAPVVEPVATSPDSVQYPPSSRHVGVGSFPGGPGGGSPREDPLAGRPSASFAKAGRLTGRNGCIFSRVLFVQTRYLTEIAYATLPMG